jgi:predicted 2-oxoglutarate/Fe(II)-dependent dioxygenase YbiX
LILKALQYGPMAPIIRPAPADRAWMDAFQDRHAYRCLPLAISNTFGWEVLSPCDLIVEWNGLMAITDLKVSTSEDYPLFEHFAASNFSRGIVTMHTGYIFRTEPGWSLLATGPLNQPFDGLSPLTGVIETDWLPYPFTMNWQVTRPGRYELPKGTPFCHLFPVRQDALEAVRFEIADISAEDGLKERQEAFAARRGELMETQKESRQIPANGAKPAKAAKSAKVAAWGREYFRGQLADGFEAPRHTHKMRLADPVDLRRPGALISDIGASVRKQKEAVLPAGKSPAAEGVVTSAIAVPDNVVTTRLSGWWSGNPEELPLVEPQSSDDLLVVENFLSGDQCALIRDAFDASVGKLGKNPDGESFWDERMLWIDDVDPSAGHAKALMQQARFAAAYRIAEHFGIVERLYSDSQQLVLWNEGRSMPVHVDNAHPDGARHNTPHREFASVVYLNDDFEGGEIYFPYADCRLQPRAGMLVGFRGSAECPHGVTAVTKGVRYTMPGWYSRDPSVAERSMFTVF